MPASCPWLHGDESLDAAIDRHLCARRLVLSQSADVSTLRSLFDRSHVNRGGLAKSTSLRPRASFSKIRPLEVVHVQPSSSVSTGACPQHHTANWSWSPCRTAPTPSVKVASDRELFSWTCFDCLLPRSTACQVLSITLCCFTSHVPARLQPPQDAPSYPDSAKCSTRWIFARLRSPWCFASAFDSLS